MKGQSSHRARPSGIWAHRGLSQTIRALVGRWSVLRPSACLGFMIAFGLGMTGCVERRMTIRTNVDNAGGALVLVDNQEIGTTPVSTAFTYYADREIRLIKDGHETVTLIQPIPAPWWDSLFLEFFIENLWPATIRDEREFHYVLPPVANVTTGELLERAQNKRDEGQGGAMPLVPGRAASPTDRVVF